MSKTALFAVLFSADPENVVPVFRLSGGHCCWMPLDEACSTIALHCRLKEIDYSLADDWSLEHFSDALFKLVDYLIILLVHLIGESRTLVGFD